MDAFDIGGFGRRSSGSSMMGGGGGMGRRSAGGGMGEVEIWAEEVVSAPHFGCVR